LALPVRGCVFFHLFHPHILKLYQVINGKKGTIGNIGSLQLYQVDSVWQFLPSRRLAHETWLHSRSLYLHVAQTGPRRGFNCSSRLGDSKSRFKCASRSICSSDEQAHPIAFLEFTKTRDGKTERLGPRNESEEQQVHEQWKVGPHESLSHSS
jgi:hypothetical protein